MNTIVREHSNQLHVITPYWDSGTWVFDQPELGLIREPFVMNADAMLTRLVRDAGVEHPLTGFKLLFSAQPFPGAQQEGIKLREESGGAWYRTEEPAMEGWLCPALLRFFPHPPERLFVRAETLVPPVSQGDETFSPQDQRRIP